MALYYWESKLVIIHQKIIGEYMGGGGAFYLIFIEGYSAPLWRKEGHTSLESTLSIYTTITSNLGERGKGVERGLRKGADRG